MGEGQLRAPVLATPSQAPKRCRQRHGCLMYLRCSVVRLLMGRGLRQYKATFWTTHILKIDAAYV